MDRGIWQAMVHVVAQSQTQLKQLSTHTQGSQIVDQGKFFMKKLKKKNPQISILQLDKIMDLGHKSLIDNKISGEKTDEENFIMAESG